MINLIRSIHRYAALVVMAFLTMYFLTGYFMTSSVFREIFWEPPIVTTRTGTLVAADNTEPEIMAARLQREFRLHGQRWKHERGADGSVTYFYRRPGTQYMVVVPSAGGSVEITEERYSLPRLLEDYHSLKGYGGGLIYDIWMVFYDLACVAAIVFALTGIYMWYKLTTGRRLLGWVILGGSYSFVGASLLFLIYAR